MTERIGTSATRRLGDFEIVRELGRGGMGVVYEARQLSLNRKVALKVLSASLGLTSTAVVRFRREAEAAAKLHHTNIVPIYATGEADGTHYYAMELIEGPSLNLVIRQMRSEPRDSARADAGPPERPRASEEPRASARADADTETTPPTDAPLPPWVAETMTRDGPPADAPPRAGGDSSTTMRSGSEYFDTVARLIADVADALNYAHDQGVIHRDIKPSNLLLSPAGRLSVNDFGLARMLEQPGMTVTGEFVGSPLYMSPEQIAVGRAPLDHRTDIYSLGATLYELLTLAPPFPGERRDQVIAQIIHKEPKRPRRLNKKVPVDLQTICLKAMEKDPDRRYQTAGAMAEDLRRFVNRFAISAKRAGPIARTVKWVRRRPAVAALMGVVLLVSAGAAVVAYRSHLVAEKARIAEGQRALDQALTEALSGRYDQVERWLEEAEVLDVDPGRIRVLRGLAAVERADTKTAVHELELAVRQLPESLGAKALLLRAYLEGGQLDKVFPLGEKIQEMTPVTPEDYLYGAWAMIIWWPERSTEWLETLARERPTPAVHYVLGIHRVYELMDSYDPAEIDKTAASLAAAKTQMPGNVRAIWLHAVAHLVSADIYKLQGDMLRHQLHLDEARKGAQHLLQEHGESGDAHVANAQLAMYEGRWEEAASHLRDAVGRHGLWGPARFYLPQLLYRLGRYDEALTELHAMPEGLQAAAVWTRDRAFIVAELHGADEADGTYRRWRGQYGTFLTRFGRYMPHEIYCLLGRPEDAIRLSREHLAAVGPLFHPEPFDLAADRYVSGQSSDEALLAAATKHGDRTAAHYLVGLARLADGDRAGAVEHFEEVERMGHFLYTPTWAHLLLKRLREDPTWPPWIPAKDTTGNVAHEGRR